MEGELAPGITLLFYTDGITEAANADGQEFGESRLRDTLVSHFTPAGGIRFQQDAFVVARSLA